MKMVSVQKPYSQLVQYSKNITDIRIQEDIKKHILNLVLFSSVKAITEK